MSDAKPFVLYHAPTNTSMLVVRNLVVCMSEKTLPNTMVELEAYAKTKLREHEHRQK